MKLIRRFWLHVHRYAGLYMALFLIVAGLTGSILAFYHELDGWLNPERSPEHLHIALQNRLLLEPFELRERALKQVPEARIDVVNLPVKPDEAYSLMLQPRLNPVTGENFPLGYDSIALNPYTGEEIDRNPASPEQDGYFPLTRKNILQFVYALHYQLALGEIGAWLFWLAAIIWTLDCFVGFYLTLPPSRKRPLSPGERAGVRGLFGSAVFVIRPHPNPRPKGEVIRAFWQRWQVAWKVKWPASFVRVNFDLHRAFGLWTWLMLFIFAWSSVMLEIHVFNKLPPVYDSVMKVFFDYPPENPIPDLPKPVYDPAIDFRAAHAIGRRLMAEQARIRGFTVKDESLLYYEAGKGTYLYGVCTDRDIAGVCSSTAIYFDAESGKFLWLAPLPSGEYSGLTINTWLFFLHMAQIWGLPYKLFVCFMGLVIAMLSVTGVIIWWKKRKAAVAKANRLIT